MVTPTPNLAWIEDIGLIGIGANATEAAIAADLGEQNIRVRGIGEDNGGLCQSARLIISPWNIGRWNRPSLARKQRQPLQGASLW